MAEGDSPTVARRRVRLAIREASEAADLTQHQVAETMEWSSGKVHRIEINDVSPIANNADVDLTFVPDDADAVTRRESELGEIHSVSRPRMRPTRSTSSGGSPDRSGHDPRSAAQ